MNFKKLQHFMDDLHNENITIAFAESMTAGLLVNEFSKAKGASNVLNGSLVTYHPELKIRLLNVDPNRMKSQLGQFSYLHYFTTNFMNLKQFLIRIMIKQLKSVRKK